MIMHEDEILEDRSLASLLDTRPKCRGEKKPERLHPTYRKQTKYKMFKRCCLQYIEKSNV